MPPLRGRAVPGKAASGSSFYEDDTSLRLAARLLGVFDSRGRGFSGRLQGLLAQNYFSQDRAARFLRGGRIQRTVHTCPGSAHTLHRDSALFYLLLVYGHGHHIAV